MATIPDWAEEIVPANGDFALALACCVIRGRILAGRDFTDLLMWRYGSWPYDPDRTASWEFCAALMHFYRCAQIRLSVNKNDADSLYLTGKIGPSIVTCLPVWCQDALVDILHDAVKGRSGVHQAGFSGMMEQAKIFSNIEGNR